MAQRGGGFFTRLRALFLVIGLLAVGMGTLIDGIALAQENVGALIMGFVLGTVGFLILSQYYTSRAVKALALVYSIVRFLLLGAAISAVPLSELMYYALILALDYVVIAIAHYVDRYVLARALAPFRPPPPRIIRLEADDRELDFV